MVRQRDSIQRTYQLVVRMAGGQTNLRTKCMLDKASGGEICCLIEQILVRMAG